MSEKAAADGQRAVGAQLQILQEVLSVKVPQFLHVSKNNTALPPQVLGQVQPLHLGEIVLDDVAEGADVLPLGGDHLVHDVLHFAGEQKDTNKLFNSRRFVQIHSKESKQCSVATLIGINIRLLLY